LENYFTTSKEFFDSASLVKVGFIKELIASNFKYPASFTENLD